MIIPKATFLQQTYLKNKNDIHIRLKNEYTVAMSSIVSMLRLPVNHKLGRICILLPAEKFPLLVSTTSPEYLGEIRRKLENAGYLVEVNLQVDAVRLSLDWTGETQKDDQH
jgi:hypothetical protein